MTYPSWQAAVELQDTRLFDLPTDANPGAPFGALGPGAVYYANTPSSNQGAFFIKQAYLTLRRSGVAVSGGRMEIASGVESVPGNRTLAWLKKNRVGQRLVGPFGYTHVSRSFDAGRISWDRPRWNLTAYAGRPTRGGFEVDANRGIEDLQLAGASATLKSIPGAAPLDLQAFYLFYRDARDRTTRVDNRTLAERQSDDGNIAIHSLGGHAITAIEWGPGVFDALVWGTIQAGEWGRQDHFGWAFAAELGFRFARVPGAPWIRIGWNRSSGDDDPNDSDHRTFFQMLPTARIYARVPFYNLMNNNDVFTQLMVKPHRLVRLQVEHHWLSLTESRDLWYAGGGATNQRVFGFAGLSSAGGRSLAHLVDVGLTLGPWEGLTWSVYYGHAFGRSVPRNTFARADAGYFFSEITYRYSR
ncbi:MAG: alginate export family protein [bacterium]|nr:alginate export family protein [bacterium]